VKLLNFQGGKADFLIARITLIALMAMNFSPLEVDYQLALEYFTKAIEIHRVSSTSDQEHRSICEMAIKRSKGYLEN
jgi:hypothetical protein